MDERSTATINQSLAAGSSSPRDGNNLSGDNGAQAIDHKSPKILIVDDIHANLDLLRDVLKPLGAQIFFATSGAMAIDIAKNAQPDLILLDIMMPDMDGLETCRQLKAIKGFDTIPVIFVTARTDVDSLVRGFEAGGVDYITKPVKQAEVHARVNTHLQIQTLIRQQRETLSALELARKELQQLSAAKDKFLSNISRSLHDSLAEISASSQALKDTAATTGQPVQGDANWRLEDVNRSARNVLKLLENILEWPRVQAGQKLDLLDMEITDRDLGYLVGALDNLRFLSLAGTRITDDGLEYIRVLKDLQELHLDGTAITNKGLELIKELENVEVLDLKDTTITDDGLTHLKPLRNLKSLYLTRTPISDAGLAHIGMLTGLQTLILWNTQVTDDGLHHLRSLTALRELILWQTLVTEHGADELRKALPDCDISTGMFT